MQTPQGRPMSTQQPTPDQTPAPTTKLVEVEMVKKYCPFFLVRDGDVVPNDAETKENIMPGIVKLHPKDAQVALSAQAAMPTHNTFKDL